MSEIKKEVTKKAEKQVEENPNLSLYNRIKAVPESAQKTIEGGRLKGMTDINPMWRIRTLTEEFGVCGIGWKPVIKKLWTEPGENGEVAMFCDISLSVKVDGEWSAPIPGIGGAMFISAEKSGLYTDDEAPKKAYTDALSVACKALGMGADVYWQKGDGSKYNNATNKPDAKATKDIDFAKSIEIKYGDFRGRKLGTLSRVELQLVASGTNEFLKKSANILLSAQDNGELDFSSEEINYEETPF